MRTVFVNVRVRSLEAATSTITHPTIAKVELRACTAHYVAVPGSTLTVQLTDTSLSLRIV